MSAQPTFDLEKINMAEASVDAAFEPITAKPTRIIPEIIHARCILALDLGTKTGYALRRRDGTVLHGTESFTPRASWTPGQRWQRFRSWLSEVIVTNQVHGIAYESVHRHVGTEAAHVYGAFLAIMQMQADAHSLTLHPVGVMVVKKHWTGKGAAKKDEMIAEAKRKGFRPDSDNAADALAILSWAVKQEGES